MTFSSDDRSVHETLESWPSGAAEPGFLLHPLARRNDEPIRMLADDQPAPRRASPEPSS